VYYRFSELMQRIFKHGNIQNTSLTPGKKVNILILNAFLRHHIQELYTFKKWPGFFGPTCKTAVHGSYNITHEQKCQLSLCICKCNVNTKSQYH